MAKREGSSGDSGPRTRSKVAKERREAEEVASIQRLDKLPKDLWEKIFIELIETDVRDLASLAMSCRYFRQKQELVETRLVEERMRLAEERRRKEEERARVRLAETHMGES